MRRRAIGYATAGVLVLVTVAACTGSTGAKGSRAAAGAVAGAGADAGGGVAAKQPAAYGAVPPQGRDHAVTTSSVVIEAKIRTAQINVDIKGAANVAKEADAAADIAIRAGGEVDADERSSGKAATATMQLRVPPARLLTVLNDLGRLGRERHRNLSVTDVSEKVADVNSRVLSAEDAIARLRLLYRSSGKVAEIIAVENELSQREADLESLQAEQRTLDRQTAMAVITLNLRTAPKVAVAKHKAHKHDHGFLAGLRRGWHGFVVGGGWLATAVGTALPFLVLTVLLALGAEVLRRRVLHRVAPTPAPTPAE